MGKNACHRKSLEKTVLSHDGKNVLYLPATKNRRANNPYSKLYRAITFYEFGACIEVTNSDYSKKKQKQVDCARSFLSVLVGDKAKLVSGVALVQASEKAVMSHPDFYIDINAFDEKLFKKSCVLALNSPFLQYPAQKNLEEFLQASETTELTMHYLLESTKNREKVRDIKAVVLEIYVAEMFRTAFEHANISNYRLFTRQGYRYYERKDKCDIYSGEKREVDLIIACPAEKFTTAVRLLRTLFPKVKTDYLSQKLGIKVYSSVPYQTNFRKV